MTARGARGRFVGLSHLTEAERTCTACGSGPFEDAADVAELSGDHGCPDCGHFYDWASACCCRHGDPHGYCTHDYVERSAPAEDPGHAPHPKAQ